MAGEAYPKGVVLRLPIMPHLRPPTPQRGGAAHYPIYLPDGTIIETSDKWAALRALQDIFTPNSAAAVTAALAHFPPSQAKAHAPTKRHKSQVNPLNDKSVIAWFNDNHTLLEVLEAAGAALPDNYKVGAMPLPCPYHDDKSPLL